MSRKNLSGLSLVQLVGQLRPSIVALGSRRFPADNDLAGVGWARFEDQESNPDAYEASGAYQQDIKHIWECLPPICVCEVPTLEGHKLSRGAPMSSD